jgi:hypothetical protein
MNNLLNTFDIIRNYLQKINQNNVFLGLTMILMNIGGRYIEVELSNNHKKFFSSKFGQYFFLFIIVFTATRDILLSLFVTIIFIIIVLNLFHENSKLCILPKSFREIDTNNDGILSPEEIKQAYLKLKAQGKVT